MEKFCLKWNDFQTNVTNSFKRLKDEKDFFDVTLVTEDNHFVSAHKVVLAASSELFKNILKKADHSKPMIYLNGMEFKELSWIIDYIYEGEINIFQEDLDRFLGTAEKLKIEGLISDKEENDETFAFINDHEDEQTNNDEVKEAYTDLGAFDQNRETIKVIQTSESTVYQEAKKAVDDLVIKVGKDAWVCKACNKTAKRASDIRKHAEVHIEGLSFPCPACGDSFRSRNALHSHGKRCASKIL